MKPTTKRLWKKTSNEQHLCVDYRSQHRSKETFLELLKEHNMKFSLMCAVFQSLRLNISNTKK